MGDYEKKEFLGEGQFGKVWLVEDHARGLKLAFKEVESNPLLFSHPTAFYNEPCTLQELQHENIVRVEDAGRLPNGNLYIAMEYLPKGSVTDVWGENPVPLMLARAIICDICWALEYAHSEKKVIHRDIKPGNILISDNFTAKLSDFGLATHIPTSGDVPRIGYWEHIAPESFETGRMNVLTDIYALGVTAYRILNGKWYLPEYSSIEELINLIRKGKYPDRKRYRPFLPDSMLRTVNKAMHVDPEKRYQSAADFRDDLANKVRLQCAWWWRRSKKLGKRTYNTKIGLKGKKIKVKVVVYGKRGEIITTKKFQSGYEKKVNADCSKGLSEKQMEKRLHEILDRYVTEGK